LRLALVLAGCALTATPASAEITEKSDAGFVSRSSADIAKPPMEVWTTLIAPAGWWNKAHSWSGDSANLYIDAQAGGCFCELLPLPKDSVEGARRGSVEHMRVIHANPGQVLRLTGALGQLQGEAAVGTLTIMLKPVGGGTHIVWEYVVGGYMRFKSDEIAPAVDKVMSEQLDRLVAKIGVLEGAPTEESPAPAAAL
jgi:hypothetical protein